ncbi:uncharacterized protein LOC132805443 [Ziziphus jujuba]|uniref:Epidermal patterning factor-like protein n=1 Tax=Ziziphus jujuba TaxID=326968 RepID=A0ABM4AIE5_ZIZJJ|nr:uncharacterized protein LOC132805443 [Ziziphus jujuba]
MQQEAKARKVVSVITTLIHGRTIQSIARSPSPSPAIGIAMTDDPEPFKGIAGKSIRGSFPTTCKSKCNLCEPCIPVEVSVRSNGMALEENYYLQVWKCICGGNIFSP